MAHRSGARAGIFLQGFAKGGNGLVQPRRPALPRAERRKRIAEIVLGCCPLERHARACQFLQGFAIGGGGLVEPGCPALPLAEHTERIAEIHLGHGPVERKSVPGPEPG
jgi:hypothetical protein